MMLNGIFKHGRTCRLRLEKGHYSESFKAHIQPIRYKTKLYLEGDFTEIGVNKNDVYLYLGPANHDLTCLSEDARVIDSDNALYKIDRCERVMLGDKCVYIWAVIRKTTEVNI